MQQLGIKRAAYVVDYGLRDRWGFSGEDDEAEGLVRVSDGCNGGAGC